MAEDLRTTSARLRDAGGLCTRTNSCHFAKLRRRELGAMVDAGEITFEQAHEQYESDIGICPDDFREHPTLVRDRRHGGCVQNEPTDCGMVNFMRRELDPRFLAGPIIKPAIAVEQI